MTWSRRALLAALLTTGTVALAIPRNPRAAAALPDLGERRSTTDYVPAQAGPRGSYKSLLKQIQVPEDQKTYGDFCDFGFWSGTAYAGHDDLPSGYWVYLAPNWYIFKEEASPTQALQGPRNWGPEQATGSPDSWPRSGDLTTAWASRTQDEQREWLELTYEHPIRPSAVLVYETYNPGAVDRVTGYNADGKEVELWSGSDPTPAGKEKGISVIPVHPDFDLTRIRVYIDSPKVPGWNEIDAVGLLDEAGVTQWAKSATASSTYADLSSSTPELELSSQPVQTEKLGQSRGIDTK